MRSSFKRRNDRPSPREIKGEEKLAAKHVQLDSGDGKFPSPLPITCYFSGMVSNLNRTDSALAELSLQNSSASFSSIVCDSSSTESEDEDYFISSKVQNQIPYYSPGAMDESIPLHREKCKASKSNHGRYGDGKMATDSTASSRGKRRKFRKKKEIIQVSDDDDDDRDGNMILEDLNMPKICVVDPHVVSTRHPAIWFQLVASNIKDYHDKLPSLPPYYIRIKDVNMTVCTIKKYLVAKLGLKSANELEINMQGEPVHPDTELWRLMKIWVESEKRWVEEPCAAAGSSGEDLVMIFSYSRSSGIEPF